jgi:hypothetical protein
MIIPLNLERPVRIRGEIVMQQLTVYLDSVPGKTNAEVIQKQYKRHYKRSRWVIKKE